MKRIALVLVAATALVAALPLMTTMVSAIGAAVGRPSDVPRCTFDHPESLPGQASGTATDALDDRSTHCPPTIPSP